MPDVAFVASPAQDHLLHELAATLAHELGRQGVPATVHVGAFPAATPDRVFILMNPREYTALSGADSLPGRGLLKRTIFVCEESPPTDRGDAHLELLQRAGAVFALDRRHVVTLHRLGVPARLLRPGYSKVLDHFDPAAQRPIDIAVLGAHSPRRSRYLGDAAVVLARHNCLISLAEPHADARVGSLVLGAERWPLLARTKVLLSMHRDENEDALEWRMALDAIHAGAVVVSEHSTQLAPLEVGRHLLVASPQALPYVADALLRDPDRLAALRAESYERLSTWIPFALPVSVLRAAIVEVVGEPLPSELPRPVAPPLVALPGIAPAPTASTPTASTPSASTPSESPAASSGRPATPQVGVVAESPAWSARRAPRVSVVCALGDDAGVVGPTLESIARSRMRDLEVIVVHAREASLPGDAAARWSAAHPWIAARVLAVAGRFTPAELRDAGARVARSPLCLVLEAGHELFPRALDVLAETLEAMPEIAFVYPIAQVTGASGSFVGTAVQPPLLIRTDVLRGLLPPADGSAPAGTQDDDLGARVERSGHGGQLLAQLLARRREPDAAPVRPG